MAGVRTLTVWLMNPKSNSLSMMPSWKRPPMSRIRLNWNPCKWKDVEEWGPSQERFSRIRFLWKYAGSGWWHSDPQPVRISERILASRRFEGSSMSWPLTSLTLRNTLKFFICCRRNIAYTVLMSSLFVSLTVFFFRLGSFSFELPIKTPHCHFCRIVVDVVF